MLAEGYFASNLRSETNANAQYRSGLKWIKYFVFVYKFIIDRSFAKKCNDEAVIILSYCIPFCDKSTVYIDFTCIQL